MFRSIERPLHNSSSYIGPLGKRTCFPSCWLFDQVVTPLIAVDREGTGARAFTSSPLLLYSPVAQPARSCATMTLNLSFKLILQKTCRAKDQVPTPPSPCRMERFQETQLYEFLRIVVGLDVRSQLMSLCL